MSKITTSQEIEGDDAFYLSNVEIAATYEFFQLALTSGTNKKMYLTSPSHAKRIAALLTQWVQLYENQFGPIQTTPQSNQETGSDEKKIGFDEKGQQFPESPEAKKTG